MLAGQPHIDRPALAAFLGQLEYPVSYLDFETIGTAIPLFDGVSPYQQVPFQYSLHIVRQPGAKSRPEHRQFLGRRHGGPAPGIHAPTPRRHCRQTGSVVAYNAGFETSRLKECCELLPEFKPWLRKVTPRIVDLLLPFRGFRYHHPDQNGSNSMKAVLPALTGQGYEKLAIQEGDAASREFLRVTFGEVHRRRAPPRAPGVGGILRPGHARHGSDRGKTQRADCYRTGLKIMPRNRKSNLELLLKLPWWVSAVLGVASFVALRWVIPARAGPRPSPPIPSPSLCPNWLSVPLALFALIAVGSFLFARKRHRLVDEQTSLEKLRETGWKDFEYLVAEAFRRQGYDVDYSLGRGADGGVDLTLRRDGRTSLVQCKTKTQVFSRPPWERMMRFHDPVKEQAYPNCTQVATQPVPATSEPQVAGVVSKADSLVPFTISRQLNANL